jgi:cytidylate kinase
MIITIDGPTASGKSTAARLLAHELGYYYLASGLLFRALAYLLVQEKKYSLQMLSQPSEHDVAFYLESPDFTYTYDPVFKEQVCYKGKQLTPYLKSKEIDQAASILSTNPLVREYLMNMQRSIAQRHDIVVDGRDCGSVVFPYAQVKFYLTADLVVRAQRWREEQLKKGIELSFEQAKKEVEVRDLRDMSREIAPLKVPEGAVIVDNTKFTMDETVAYMKSIL